MVSTDESFNFYGCYLSRTTPRTSIHFQDPAGGGFLPGEVTTKIDWLIEFWLCLFLSLVTALLMAIANNNEPEEHGTFLLKISKHVSSSIEYVIKNICTVWSKQVSFFLGIFRYKVKHDQTKASWIRYLEMNFVEVATASRKCSDVFKFRPRLNSHVSRFKAISWSDRALFKLHIFKRKSLQLIWLKISRKRDPRASVLNNPLYNGKICAYVWRNSKSNFDKGRLPYCRYYKNRDFQC